MRQRKSLLCHRFDVHAGRCRQRHARQSDVALRRTELQPKSSENNNVRQTAPGAPPWAGT